MAESPESLLRRADKKAQGHALSFLSGGPHYDEAAQLYAAAGNKYKLDKNLEKASECFVKVAFMQNKQSDANSEATAYVEAANLIKKVKPREAVTYYENAIQIYNGNGRFGQSAKLLKGMAEFFEETGEMRDAAKYFKKAAELLEMDEYGKSQYSQCIVKYADISAKLDSANLREAIQIYEKEGEKALRNTLIQFNAKEHFFKAGILLLAIGDAIDARISCDRYDDTDPRFSGSREGKLLRKLVEAYEGSDLESFVEAIRDYDSITKLDAWKINFLYKVKDSMAPASDVLRHAGSEEDPDNLDMT